MKTPPNIETGIQRSGASAAPATTRDLLPSERQLVEAMRDLGFGRFEFVQIRNGLPVIDPWPTAVRDVKFASKPPEQTDAAGADFDLKRQVVELFEYTRSVDAGEIRTLEVRHGLPFSMEIETGAQGGRHA